MPAYGIVVAAVITVASELLILAGSYCPHAPLLRVLPGARARSCRRSLAAAAMAGAAVACVGDAPRCLLLVVLGAALYGGLVLAAISPASRRLLEGLRP